MNCKSIQMSLAVDERIGPHESEHIEACTECRSFAAYCASVGARLSRPVLGPEGLPDGEVVKKPTKGWDWRGVAMAATSVVVLVGPVATYLIRAHRAASDAQAFHVVVKGTSYVFGQEDPMDCEVWFDGKRIRFTAHNRAMDDIMWVEGNTCWRSWNPDGVLKTEKAPMASPDKTPPDFVSEGRYASAKFFDLYLKQWAPITPSKTGQWADLPDEGPLAVSHYEIKPHHVGMANRWQEDYRSDVLVYTNQASGKIVKIRQVLDEGNGKTATIEFDYDYEPIPASQFDPNTLQPTPTKVAPMARSGG